MLRNEWLRMARIKEFKKRAEIVLFTQVDDQFADWIDVALPGRYTWQDDLSIAIDDDRPVYGFYVYYEDRVVYTQQFGIPRFVKVGDVLKLELNAETVCP